LNILLVFALTAVAFQLAYRFYGRYLEGQEGNVIP
jgi:hypothetical protein